MALDINIGSYAMLYIAAFIVLLAIYSFYREFSKARNQTKGGIKNKENHRYNRVNRVAILIASKDGEKTIRRTVGAALSTRCHVYVVSDGSSDRTIIEALDAGAQVMWLRKNVGKPAALYAAYRHFNLSRRFDAVAILDDDVVIEKDFIKEAKKAMDQNCAISVGRNLTDWPEDKKWNIWLASRAYSYWAYQITLRTIQSSYNVMSCISGSNSLYRTEVLDKVLKGTTPYIVDDTYWTLETHRLQLGEIKYARKANAWLQDPTNFKDWYKQNLRWMWGTFQGILGHKIGLQANKFHISYLALMMEWVVYIFSGPLLLLVIWQAGINNLTIEILLLLLGYAVWVVPAAIFLKTPRLVFFIPAIVLTDLMFRWIMVHGLIKAFRQRTVESCIWESPKRFDTRQSIAKV